MDRDSSLLPLMVRYFLEINKYPPDGIPRYSLQDPQYEEWL